MKRHNTFFFYCGLLMLLSEIWKQWCLTYQLNDGHYIWWHFPFQLCSIPMYLCVLLPFVSPENLQKIFLTFLMDFGLLAGIFTFFDTSGLHYSYTPLTVHSFVWHILLIIIGIYAGYCGKADHSVKGYKKSAGIYLACCLTATIFNLLFHSYGTINLFYINPYYDMTQKIFSQIADLFGNTIGIIIYILTILFGAWILHQLWKHASAKIHTKEETSMALEKVILYFEQLGLRERIKIFEQSSATVELAAQAVGCEPARIAKTLSLFSGDAAILIVTAGDAKIDNKKYKGEFHQKARMIPSDLVESYIGHAPGGVCPFVIKEGIPVYLDVSLKRFTIVYPAAGSANSAVELYIAELEKYSGASRWVDVCKLGTG